MDAASNLFVQPEVGWLPTDSTVDGTAHRQPRWAKSFRTCQWPVISVVIPALNEAENLRHVLPLLPPDVDEVLLVDGRSTDDTVEVARQLWPNIRIVQQEGRGKGAALRTGMACARGDIIVMMDADGSTDPRELPAFIGALMSGADFAKGSRFLQGAGSADITFSRRAGNWGFTSLVRILCGGSYTDLCYGYNAFWADVLPILDLDANGFEIETQMNVRALMSGIKVTEVSSFEAPRVYGESRLRTFPDGWRVLKTILREWLSRPRAPKTESRARPEPRPGRRESVWAMLSGDCRQAASAAAETP